MEKGSPSVCYIISDVEKSLQFEALFLALNSRFSFHVIVLSRDDTSMVKFLIQNNIAFKNFPFSTKWEEFLSIILISKQLKIWKVEITHCHLFRAGVVGTISAWIMGIEKRFYTRHYSDLHLVNFPRTVIVDKLINRLSTKVIAISRNVSKLLIEKEGLNPHKIETIYHGYDFSKLDDITDSEIDAMKARYDLGNKLIIGVVARYTEWKGIQFIIEAFNQLLQEYPNSIIVLANAEGDYSTEIKALLSKLDAESYREIVFEENIFCLYKCFDIFIHTPTDSTCEAFGQTYIESLACKIPSIFTLSGVATEFIKHEENALVVDYKNSRLIFEAIKYLLNNQDNSERIALNGHTIVLEKFSLLQMVNQLDKLYQN